MNYLDRRRSTRGMLAEPTTADPQSVLERLGCIATFSPAVHAEATICRRSSHSLPNDAARVSILLRWGGAIDTFEHVPSTHPAVHPAGEHLIAPGDPFLHWLLNATRTDKWPDARAVGSVFLVSEQQLAKWRESALNILSRFRGGRQAPSA